MKRVLVIGLLIMAVCVSAFSGEEEEEGRFERPFGRYGYHSRQFDFAGTWEVGSRAFERKGLWMLEPEVFGRLSAGGRRMVLRSRGLLARGSRVGPLVGSERALMGLGEAGENVRVNDPLIDELGHAQNESSIAARGSNIIIGFNDASFNSAGYSLSTDGGATFNHRRVPTVSDGSNEGDPVLAFGPNGEIYYGTLAFTANGKSIIGVAKSVDGGRTFSPPVDASTLVSDTNSFQDKEWIAVDTEASSPFRGNVYVSWTGFTRTGTFIFFSRSTNGGASFDAPVMLSSSPQLVQGSMPALAPNGDIYVVYSDSNFNASGGISLVKSIDGGRSFSAPKPVTSLIDIDNIFITGGNGLRARSFPSIAVDRSGILHIVYAAVPSNSVMDRSDIFYVRSTNGNSFSTPQRLNDDTTQTTQFLPSVAAGSDGSVAVKWWDRRNDPINDSMTDVYMTISTDSGKSFGKNFRITDNNWAFGPTDPNFFPRNYHGDYDHIAADGGNFFLCWSDERNADPDVFFTRIPATRNQNSEDFIISTTKVFDSVTAGGSVDFPLGTSVVNGFNGELTLSASPSISGLTYNFRSPRVVAGQQANLTISTTAALSPGSYLITVAASGSGITRKTTFRLSVFEQDRIAGMPVNLTRSPGISAAGSSLQIDSRGTIHLAFEDDSSNVSGRKIFYMQSSDGGKNYSTPIEISTNRLFSLNPALALDTAGNIYIVWGGMNQRQTDMTVFISKSIDGGKSFSFPMPVSSPSQIADLPAIALGQRGALVVTYSDFRTDSPRLFAVRSNNGGADFSIPVQISRNGESVMESYAAFDSQGAAYIVYSDLTATTSRVNLSISEDGRTFSAPKMISEDGTASFSPHIAIDKNNNIYVASSDCSSGCISSQGFLDVSVTEIRLIKSSNGGKSFSSPINISDNNSSSLLPYLIIDKSGNVNVAWQDTRDERVTGNEDILLARSTDGGVTFSRALNLSSNPGRSVGAAGASDSNGNLFIIWTDDSTANPDLFISSLQFFKPQSPAITGFNPTGGPIGSEISIFGSNLQNASAVLFSRNVAVPQSDFKLSDDGTQIRTKVPQGAETGTIAVITPAGTAVSAGIFTVTQNSDFLLTINPGSQTVVAGTSALFSVSLQSAAGFEQPVDLSAALSSNSNDVTATFSSTTITQGNSATLTVSTSQTTPASTLIITITGTSNGIVRNATATVDVIAPDFTLLFTSDQMTLIRGQAGQLTININRTGGFAGNVTVTAPDTKPFKIKLTPPVQSTTGTSLNFNFKIKKSARPGTQQLTFSGRDESGRVRTGILSLIIQ